jgi:DNA helicase-2/ATP-dependent DNA helicase PcrA
MLNQSEQNKLIEELKRIHSGDEKQLEVIFSESPRIIVESPAGYGKTKTMISKVAYLLATGRIVNPKKILALTFSVNAAYKIKKELSEQLPQLIQLSDSKKFRINEKLFVSNYHGFCRHILKRYGYLLHPNLSNLDQLKSIDDSKIQEMTTRLRISFENANIFSRYDIAIKARNQHHLQTYFTQYTESIIENFVDKGFISFNAILALSLRIFRNETEICKFYQAYFPILIVDEFQDTNLLNWALLKRLISDKTELLFMGDSLQKIYGFIGVINNLIPEAERLYSMEKITLEKNYRFMSNPQMLQLDKNIRLNAENTSNPNIEVRAEIPLIVANNQLEESEKIVQMISRLLDEDTLCKLAILVNQRTEDTNKIIQVLNKSNISYFDALFKDNHPDCVSFHKECSSQFTDQMRESTEISPKKLKRLYLNIVETFKNNNSSTIKSLMRLLEVFLSRTLNDYSFLNLEDKLILIKDTFDNRTLRQNMEYVNDNVVISTIHGAKGLEWNYVLMPDMEQYSMYGLCKNCNHQQNCKLIVDNNNEEKFLEQLSVFYVGVTRARKQVFFFASKTSLQKNGTTRPVNLSCLLNLPSIVLVEREVF